VNWLLTPMAGVILAAAVIPPLLALYFLRLRRKPRTVASTMLWMHSVEDLRANTPFQRLRPSILLFLQILALLLLALAIAQPQWDLGRQRGGRAVLLIDNSGSMAAIDGPGGISRLEHAKELAVAWVERLHGGGLFGGSPGEVMVIAFSDRAEVATPFTDSRQQLIAAINGVQQTDAPSRIAEALRLSRAFTTNVNPDLIDRPVAEHADLVLFSDGRIDDLSGEVLRHGETLDFVVVGRESDNVGVLAVAADRPYDRPGQVQVFVTVANYGFEPVSCDVQLSVDGTVLAITPRPVEIPAARIDETSGLYTPGLEQVAFRPFEQRLGAVIEVATLREDVLPIDDVAAMVVPPPRRLNVALVGAPIGFFLRDVLEGLEASLIGRLDLLSPTQFLEAAGGEGDSGSSGSLDRWDVVILDDVALDALPPGQYLSFGATPPVSGFNEFGTRESVLVRASRADHPIFRFVELDDLFIVRMRALSPSSEVTVLADALEGPIVLSVDRGPLKLIHVTFNPLDSNGPFGRSLVNFVCNAVEFLGNIRDAAAIEGLRPGQAISLRLPPTARDIQLRLPDGTQLDVPTIDPEQFSWGPVRRVGIHEVSWLEPNSSDRQRRLVAVNLADDRVGRIEPQERLEFGMETISGDRAGDGLRTPLWPWALALCVGLLLVEWFVYLRRAGV